MNWHLVNSAPKDGEMLGWSKQHGLSLVNCGDWIERDGGIEYFNGDVYCAVTHWQPAPVGPDEVPE